MDDTGSAGGGFIRQRRAGMTAIAAAMPVALLLWLAIVYLVPPLPAMDGLADRMLFALKCFCLAVLFCLVTGVEAVAHERLSSPAFDPLSGFETQRLRVNHRYLQNTLEQIIVFAAGLFGLAAYSPDGSAMRAVLATTIVWILARLAFWIGYHRSAAMRGLGAPAMALGMIVLLYVAWRIGYEAGGFAGAAVPVVAFLAIEVFLFRATRRSGSASHPLAEHPGISGQTCSPFDGRGADGLSLTYVSRSCSGGSPSAQRGRIVAQYRKTCSWAHSPPCVVYCAPYEIWSSNNWCEAAHTDYRSVSLPYASG